MVRLLAVFVLAGASANAQTNISGDWQYVVENGEATITGYTGIGGAVTIPSAVNGFPVKKIGNGWPPIFGSPNNSVTSVTIPSSVTVIGVNAFESCAFLTDINIPDSVTSIGDGSFAGCASLISITIPNSVTRIGEYAFSECTSLTSIIIVPSGLSSIEAYAFNGCTSLTSVSIPDSVNIIGQGAFSGCTSLTSIILPSGLTSIEAYTFFWCSSLTSITIPNGVTSIKGTAFTNCTNLTNVTIPESVASIAFGAFENCTALTSVIMPDRFLAQIASIGITGQVASDYMINALASNINFVTAVATNDAFVTAVANKILATSNNYGLATKSGVTSVTSTLATKTELTNSLNESRTDGINSVISNPNLWTLYTTNQIKAMVMGDLMLTRTNNGQFVLNYDIEQSDNLTTWAPYQNYVLPLTNLPTDKAFVRIKLKNQQ